MAIQNFFTSRDNTLDGPSYVGQLGRLWYDPDTNSIYVSDGVTPGGIPVISGTSYSNANVVALLADFGSNNIATTGNITANFYSGDGSQLTNITTDRIANGVNFLRIDTTGFLRTANNALNLSVDAFNSLEWTVSPSTPFFLLQSETDIIFSGNSRGDYKDWTFDTTGVLTAPGNINIGASYYLGNGRFLTGIEGTGDYSNANVFAYLGSGSNVAIVTSGNVALTGPSVALGNVGNVHIYDGSSGQVLSTDGTGNLSWVTVAGAGGANTIPLGTPADGNLTGNNVAIDTWTPNTYVTDSVDDLNEVLFNVIRGTYVGQLDFAANVTSGPSPLSVLFTSTVVGNVNQWAWDFGDGNTSATGPNVTHTYSNATGGLFTVSVTATNTGAVANSAGSSATRQRTDYITLFTPLPAPGFTANRTSLDTGGNVELTNTSQYATSYSLDWGDGNIVDPGNLWTTTEHLYSAPANTDSLYSITLTGINQTAGPTPPYSVTTPATPVRVYTPQSPAVTANVLTIINSSAVSFRNDTPGQPGNTAAFGAQQFYRYQWGDGTANTTVNIQPGLAGNPGAANIDHTFNLSAGQQTAGTTVAYTANLWLYTGYSTSPFTSTNLVISVEPRVIAGFQGQANTISDRTGDTAQTGYIYTDYLGRNRALFEFENQTSPTPPFTGNTFSWNWGDGTFDNTVSSSNVTHSWSTTGSKTVALTASGQPNTLAQSNTLTRSNYITIAANPTAPSDLSAYTLTLGTASQGTNPRLAAGAADNTGGSIVANGAAITRYVTSTPIVSGTVDNANTSVSGTLTAYISNTATGQATFSAGGNAVGTYSALSVLVDADAHTAINPAVYPSYFYKVFDARISQALSSIAVGYNTYLLGHSITGNTTAVGFVRDNLSSVPTLSNAAVTVTEVSSGTLVYISGVPYYGANAQLSVNGLAVTNFTGQAYTDIASPLFLNSGTASEGTTGQVIGSTPKTYAQLDGAVSYLTGGIPNANVGISSSYTFGNLTANTASGVRAVATISSRITNLNGQSAARETPTLVQVYSAAITGINEAAIPVSDSLGTIYTDDGVRITGFGSAANTPAFSGSTNYYTSNAWSGAVTVAGTQESIVRWGNASHFTTDLSTGYLPTGPDLNTGRSGLQYFTFAFRRATVANFDIILTGTVAGVWIAAPGTQIDSTSGLSGWLDASTQYAGSGIPGSNTGAGGNGSDGSALTGADRIPLGSAISNQRYTQTLGGENSSNATGNNILVRIALASGTSISDIQIGVAT